MVPVRVLAIAALVVVAVAQGNPKNGNVELVNDPAACASALADTVASITSASNAIVKSVAACPPKTEAGSGKDSACAAGIVQVFEDLSRATERLSDGSRDCANTMATQKGGQCGTDIAATIKSLSLSSGCLIASTESCKPPSEGGNAFGCVVDVVDVVDSLANAAHDIANSVKSCQAVKTPNPTHTYLYNTWLSTGCQAIPSPDWLQWGYWYANAQDSAVLEEMFEWCTSAGNGNFHDKHHSARLCCGSTSGSCDPEPVCNVQNTFTGSKTLAPVNTRSSADRPDWPRYLQ